MRWISIQLFFSNRVRCLVQFSSSPFGQIPGVGGYRIQADAHGLEGVLLFRIGFCDRFSVPGRSDPECRQGPVSGIFHARGHGGVAYGAVVENGKIALVNACRKGVVEHGLPVVLDVPPGVERHDVFVKGLNGFFVEI
jgi:hypothetical protein